MSRVSLLQDVHDGTERWTIIVRVLRKWNVYQKSSPNELFCITMILVDQEGTKIQASLIAKNLHGQYRNTLNEGKTYFIANFIVSQNSNMYKGTTHPFKILFTQQTFVREQDANIPLYSYSFMPIQDILKSDETNYADHLIDVIAFVKSMGSLEEFRRDHETKNKLRMLLTDISEVDIDCVLFDECSTNAYMAQLENMETPVVVVINLARIALSDDGGPQICSSFNATKVLFNPPIPEVKKLIDDAKDRDSPLMTTLSQQIPTQSSQVSTSRFLLNNKRINISEINDQKIGESFVVTCLIERLETRHGWKYEGCAKCASKPRDDGNNLYCPNCKKKPDSIEPKLKIHYKVVDDSGSTSVVFWDKLATQMLGNSATELQQILLANGLEYDFPEQCDSVVGKRMLLKLKRNDFNAKHMGSSLSVMQYTMCEDLIGQFNAEAHDQQYVTAESHCNASMKDPIQGIADMDCSGLTPSSQIDQQNNSVDVSAAETTQSQRSNELPPAPTKGKRKATLRRTCVDHTAESNAPSVSFANDKLLKVIKQEKK